MDVFFSNATRNCKPTKKRFRLKAHQFCRVAHFARRRNVDMTEVRYI